jgi:hypothetical protein
VPGFDGAVVQEEESLSLAARDVGHDDELGSGALGDPPKDGIGGSGDEEEEPYDIRRVLRISKEKVPRVDLELMLSEAYLAAFRSASPPRSIRFGRQTKCIG